MGRPNVFWIGVTWWTVGSVALGAQAIRIVEDGLPRAMVLTAADADEQTRLAAELLVEYVRRSSGAELPRAEEPAQETASEPVTIHVGPCDYVSQLKLGLD
jgi:hypothetical protein